MYTIIGLSIDLSFIYLKTNQWHWSIDAQLGELHTVAAKYSTLGVVMDNKELDHFMVTLDDSNSISCWVWTLAIYYAENQIWFLFISKVSLEVPELETVFLAAMCSCNNANVCIPFGSESYPFFYNDDAVTLCCSVMFV